MRLTRGVLRFGSRGRACGSRFRWGRFGQYSFRAALRHGVSRRREKPPTGGAKVPTTFVPTRAQAVFQGAVRTGGAGGGGASSPVAAGGGTSFGAEWMVQSDWFL